MDSLHTQRNGQCFHSLHEGFVELEELVSFDNELVWKERARWIKLEEDVEECADRWGKPHIPCLTYRSLREVKTNLQNCTILLDLPRGSLLSISEAVVDEIKVQKKLGDEECRTIKAVLLARHEHQYQQKGGKHRKNITRRFSRSMSQGKRVIQPAASTYQAHSQSVKENDLSEDASDPKYVTISLFLYSFNIFSPSQVQMENSVLKYIFI